MKKNKKVDLKQKTDKKYIFKGILEKEGFKNFTASIISVIIGLLFGFLLLVILNPAASGIGLGKILFTGIANRDKMAKVLYMSAPLIMTGLSVGFAFKTGLFNIGAPGQYLLGAYVALVAAILWKTPWWVALLLSIVGGAVWGAIPGILKAYLNVNEVIATIMLNWIGVLLVNMLLFNQPKMLANYYGAAYGDRTIDLEIVNPKGMLPKWGLDKLFNSNYMNIGIFIAIFVAIILAIVLNKTTFGYELKACGYNRHASDYAGINAKRNIILSMTIAGALAGLGGGIYYLSGISSYNVVKQLQAMGFNGIPVALLGVSNPIGIIFAGIFISYIQVGGEALQPTFTSEIINIIIAVIIYMSAMAFMVKVLLTKLSKKRKNKNKIDKNNISKEPPISNDGGGILPSETEGSEIVPPNAEKEID